MHLIFRDHKAYGVTDRWVYNAETEEGKYAYDETELDSVAPYLGATIEIRRNFLFADLWKLILRDAKFYSTVFHMPLGGNSLLPWVKQANKPAKQADPPISADVEGIQYLYFDRFLEVSGPEEKEPYFSYYVGMHGWGYHRCGPEYPPKQRGKLEQISYSLSFMQVNELMLYPIQIKPKVELHCNYFVGQGKGKKKKLKYRREVLGDAPFSLYDILYALFFEISFHGAPSNQEVEKQKLNESVEQLNKIKELDPDSEEYKKHLIPADDVFKDFEKKRKKTRVRHREVADELLKEYEAILEETKDSEALKARKFYMENRANEAFNAKAEKLNKKYEMGQAVTLEITGNQ
jgi:hypothetical protein